MLCLGCSSLSQNILALNPFHPLCRSYQHRLQAIQGLAKQDPRRSLPTATIMMKGNRQFGSRMMMTNRRNGPLALTPTPSSIFSPLKQLASTYSQWLVRTYVSTFQLLSVASLLSTTDCSPVLPPIECALVLNRTHSFMNLWSQI